jgi:membrane-bound metal-dependent hydrolase YbcI (DUF457 family)
MNTPSHLIINAALRRWASAGGRRSAPSGAFLLGAVLPDIPLWLLWTGTYAYYRYVLADQTVSPMDPLFDRLYFTDPRWIAGHNLLHAPLILLGVLALCWRWRQAAGSRGHWWFWFAAGCLVHSVIDIATHHTDGPVLFFPFDWHYRVQSPVSYWDPQHYGREFAIVELLLDLALLGYLFGPGLWRRLRRGAGARGEG